MKLKGLLLYALMPLFIGWCVIAFRADLAQIRIEPIWTARYAIFFAVLLTLFNYELRVLRWTLYLCRLGHPLPIGYALLTYVAGFAFTLSPGKVGEMVRGRYYQKIGIPLSTTAAAFFIERLMDLLAMLALTGLALATASAYAVMLWATLGIIATLLALLALTPWARVSEQMQRIAWLPVRLKKPLIGVFRTLYAAKTLLHPKWLMIGFLLALLAWGAEGLGLMVIGAMFPNVGMDWATAISIYSLAIIVGVLSFLPGGLGGTEAVMAALLNKHGYPLPDAILLTLVCRLLTLWLAVALGWVSVMMLRRQSRVEVLS